jgi:hypothetical protein
MRSYVRRPAGRFEAIPDNIPPGDVHTQVLVRQLKTKIKSNFRNLSSFPAVFAALNTMYPHMTQKLKKCTAKKNPVDQKLQFTYPRPP